LQRNVRVFQRFVRNTSVSVYLLPTPGYRLSEYEQALARVQQEQYDSALVVLRGLQARHPDNTQLAFIRAGLYLFRTGDIGTGVQVLTNLADRHPNDYAVNYEVAGLFGRLHIETAYHGARALAVKYYARAADLDAYLPASLERILAGQ
jgi:predicted Zn-dependent protease